MRERERDRERDRDCVMQINKIKYKIKKTTQGQVALRNLNKACTMKTAAHS